MRIGKWIAVVVIVVLAALTSCRRTPSTHQNGIAKQDSTPARPEPERALSKDEQSCKVFVKKFYDWYVYGVMTGFCDHATNGESCIRTSDLGRDADAGFKQVLSPSLQKLISEDKAAEAAAPDDGMDYLEDHDHFIETNGDPSSRYEVENVHVKDGVCNVEVDGKSNADVKEVTIMPELAKYRGRWGFVNFHYPIGDDFVSGLKGDLKSDSDDGKSPNK